LHPRSAVNIWSLRLRYLWRRAPAAVGWGLLLAILIPLGLLLELLALPFWLLERLGITREPQWTDPIEWRPESLGTDSLHGRAVAGMDDDPHLCHRAGDAPGAEAHDCDSYPLIWGILRARPPPAVLRPYGVC